jgi:hypothetical protein
MPMRRRTGKSRIANELLEIEMAFLEDRPRCGRRLAKASSQNGYRNAQERGRRVGGRMTVPTQTPSRWLWRARVAGFALRQAAPLVMTGIHTRRIV